MVAELGPARGNGVAAGDCRKAARSEIVQFRGRSLSEASSAIVATFDGPALAVRCASAIVEGARRNGIAAKAGLHTGECDVQPDGLTGAALDIARRIAAGAKAGDVLVSATVRDLIAGSRIEFVPRGGLPVGRTIERRPLFAVLSPAAAILGASATL
jgi:class 3 adenylate cyclase